MAPATAPSAAGSSPHTRGALRVGGVLGDVRGIIPAYAGSTDVKLALLAVADWIIPAYAGSTG